MKKFIIVTALFLLSGIMFGQKTASKPAPKKAISKPVTKIVSKPVAKSAKSLDKIINGQWRGYFDSKGDIIQAGRENIEYVLEIEINGTEITGYSYSYFQNRRYFVICSLAGTYYKSTKSMRVTETARIKGAMPPDWSDCLQTHILTYEKDGGTEELKGRWIPAEGQSGNCGKGITTLTRRTLSKDLASYNKSTSKPPFSDKKAATTQPLAVQKVPKVTAPPVVKTKPVPGAANPPVVKIIPKQKPVISKPKEKAVEPAIVSSKPVDRTAPEMIVPQIKTQPIQLIPTDMGFEKRTSNVIKTIEIDHSTFKVDLYDNGDVDGDSISLFYDGKLLLSHKMLSEKPISLTLDAKIGKEMELTMYADNLGIIPPNTALMVVTDGDKRYEVRIASDLKRSGTIRFKQKPDANGSSVLAKDVIK